ncbi:MAG: hypothetical protein A2156_08385 [Deltaproteobacteria bacterium RBG_16_48_10]|nr:MAG: hypothetical protein A2156_08385 [Deltaproteobacteria bacterium RBG_16_48_10]
MKRSGKKIVIGLFSLLFLLFIWNPTIALGEIKKSKASDEYAMHRETDVVKILSVLERKIGDQKSLEKAKEKLFTLKDSQLFLITSLSEQIAKEGTGRVSILLFC